MWPDDHRPHHEPEAMTSGDLAACYALAGQLRRHEVTASLDLQLRLWMNSARHELEARGHLEHIREWLPIAYDPTMKNPLTGPGAKLVTQTAIERAITPRALKTAG
jgi:hypothetical protein